MSPEAGGQGMFGRRKSGKVEVTYIGSALMTMSQAVFIASSPSPTPEGSWLRLTTLLYGVMHRRGWFPEPTDFDMRSICELVQAQTQNPYGDMQLGSTWEIYGTAPLDRERVNAVSGALQDLASRPLSVAIPSFLNELAPVMGKANKDLLSFGQALLLVHAAVTMVTVFGDTVAAPSRERQARRELASDLESEFIASWALFEMGIEVAYGRRDPGDPHPEAYKPWW